KRSSRGSKSTNGRGSRSEGRNAVSRAKDTSRLSSQQLEGREPSHDPDVFVDIRKVKVDEIYFDLEQLEGNLALRGKLGNLLQVVAGVHVHLGKVEVDISGVEAEALLKVRLENLYDILDRALTTLDRNPEILESLVKTVDDTVGSIGELGQEALGPGGGLTKTLDDVGQAAQQAVQPGGAAREALGEGVGQLGQGVGQGVGQLGQGLGQTAGQAAGGLSQAAGGSAGQAGAQVGQQAEQAMGQGGQQAGDATQAVGQTAEGAASPAAQSGNGGDGETAGGSKRRTRQTKRGSKRGSARAGGKKPTSRRSSPKSASKRSSTTRSRKKKSTS